MDLATATEAANALLAPAEYIASYRTNGSVYLFDVAPMRLDDTALIYEMGEASWAHVGPLSDDPDRFASLVDIEPTTYAGPTRPRLVADAFAAEDDTHR